MSNYDSNVYYNPEKHGLEPVAEIEYSSGIYEFDTRVVWRQVDTGVLYTARDSGCSCPTPFEDINGIAELERLDLAAIREEVRSEGGRMYSSLTVGDGMDFLAKVEAAAGVIEGQKAEPKLNPGAIR